LQSLSFKINKVNGEEFELILVFNLFLPFIVTSDFTEKLSVSIYSPSLNKISDDDSPFVCSHANVID
jgi:hypothetical protein